MLYLNYLFKKSLGKIFWTITKKVINKYPFMATFYYLRVMSPCV